MNVKKLCEVEMEKNWDYEVYKFELEMGKIIGNIKRRKNDKESNE